MNKITVIGLGVAAGAEIAGLKEQGKRIVFRTKLDATYLPFERYGFETLDGVFEQSESFDKLNKNIVAKLTAMAEQEEIIYCVPGAAARDASVEALKAKCKAVEILPSGDCVTDALADFPSQSYSVTSAISIAAGLTGGADHGARASKSVFDTDFPLIITEIDDKELAGSVKLRLADFYGEAQTAVFRISGRPPKKIKLYELDRQPGYNHTASLIIPGVPGLKKDRYGFYDLLKIMETLIGENGCEWDKAQTHESITKNMLEEAQEAVDAINNKDTDNLIEELGDVMLQSVFHATIGRKNEEFDIYDVLDRLSVKLITRHPHVFGGKKAKDAQEALGYWKKAKEEEKKGKRE